MRIYLASTIPALANSLVGQESPTLPAGPGFAVTPGLREWYASGDTEELEYTAMSLAAQASLRLLMADPDAPRRRVVVAADVDPSAVTIGADSERASRGRVVVNSAVPLARIAAIHVDHEDAVADVTAAIENPDDEMAAEDASAHELLWYATQELEDLLRQAGR